MKNAKLLPLIIGLALSMLLILPGFINFIINVVTKTGLRYNSWWLVSTIGLFLYMVFLFLVLLVMFAKRQPAASLYSQIRTSYIRQKAFTFVNILLGLGVGLFSTIFALFALNNAVSAKNSASAAVAESQLKTARSLNIAAIISAGMQWLAIVVLIFSIRKVG